MALDVSAIGNALMQKQPSVLDYAEQYAAADDRALNRQKNALLMQQTQQDMAENNALRGFRGDLASPDGQKQLMQIAPTKAAAILKGYADLDHVKAQTAQATAAASTSDQNRLIQARGEHIKRLSSVATPEDAVAWLQEGLAGKTMSPEEFSRGLANVAKASSDPASFAQWRQSAQMGGLSSLEQMNIVTPKPTEVRLGNVVKWLDMNPHSPSYGKETNPPQQIGQSPDSAASVAATIRGQNMTDARAREGLAQADRHFAATQATKTTPQSTKLADAKDVIDLLDQAKPLLSKATSSGIGAGVDAALGFVGQSTEGGDAAAQLKALEGLLISKMPKMSGPQSDKDVLLYKQMAGRIGDSTVPVSQKLAAEKTIRDINSKYLNDGGAAQPTGKTVVRTGKDASGRKVVQYSDGSVGYAD